MKITFVGNFDVDYSSESHHAKTLESLGHEVVRLREGKTTGEVIVDAALDSELLIFVHTHGWETPGLSMNMVFKTLKKVNIPSITYHLDLWLGIERQKDLEQDPFYKTIEHFFTVDKLMADWFNNNTEVKGHYIHAGVYDGECVPDVTAGLLNEVIFVGSKGYHPEWAYRPHLINQLTEHYGNKFKHFGGDGLGVVRGQALNQLYGSTKIAIGDSLCINFDYPHYWSDRVYETMGRGGFIIHPYIKGMEDDFIDGKHLVFYEFGNFEDLYSKIDYYLEHDDKREAIRKAGHEHVKANHTYKNRWQSIIDTVVNQ